MPMRDLLEPLVWASERVGNSAALRISAPPARALAGSDSPFPGDIKWNFTKFLIGRDGTILKRFDSKTTPNSPDVITAIDAALAAK